MYIPRLQKYISKTRRCFQELFNIRFGWNFLSDHTLSGIFYFCDKIFKNVGCLKNYDERVFENFENCLQRKRSKLLPFDRESQEMHSHVFSKISETYDLSYLVSDHLDQIGSGPKSWGQPVVPTHISPKNLLRGPQEGLLWPKNRGSKKNSKFFLDFFSILTGGTLWKSMKKISIFFSNPGFTAIISPPEQRWDVNERNVVFGFVVSFRFIAVRH